MSAKEDPTVETSDNEIHELNPSAMQALFPHAAFDFHKFAKDMEAEFQEFREQLQNSYNPTMRNEHNRLKSFLSYTSHSSWSLTEMAAAGFYHTLVKSSVQCFCCGLVLFTTKVRCTPYEQHKKFRPTCEFVLGKEVGNISKYDIRVQKLEKSAEHAYRYSGEDARLQSFDRWPFYARGTKPNLLARAGFFFTGKKDTVQCFTCGGCLGNWEDGDDPWREHAKWFPECEFLQSKKSSEEIKKYIETYGGFVGVVGRHFTASFMKENLSTATGDLILNIFEDEGVRLDSFKTWPAEAHVEATALAKAGFFYTGEGDKVQCFNCAGCLKEWEKGEDPMKEHAKWFPDSNCLEVLGKSLEEQPESPSTLPSVQQTQCKAHLEEKATLCSVGAELLFSNLDKFICLEELSVSQCENCNVFDRIPDGFKNLCNMKKLLMSRMKLENCSRLVLQYFYFVVEFIKSFQDLSVFHLDCSSYFDSESLLTAISSCKKLTEIKLTGSFLRDQDLLSLAAALPNFVSLKVLGLGSQYFDDKEACEIFAHSLGGVLNLEELILPAGKGIKSAAKLIVQQCLHLLHLRCFSFILCLDDDGLLEIAKVANRGGFQKLENLYLSVNHDVTETGWRNFFRTLNNMPALKELNISRMFTHQIKASASTVTAFVQCVSRLPGLVTIVMFGWLLDAEDLKMFDIMKEQHPQSRSLKLSWQWVLPLSPNFQD
ncbi:baculoviral IAP repeat-containing protein 1 isoform X6 [Grus americana]|uniref:baculoviral IAP repeat-containing protein 1 isoform X6 n=1 Tax=Grus americana TaxID=9117 RepID=UPI002408412E|nr:baculoviral IAP repeat-containing protein 1 isoform X6 [Grus americana]